jgi:hypothetical protein
VTNALGFFFLAADYDDTHATWESPENIQHAKDMVAAFEKSHVE